jgi:hypothetical protein
MTPDPAPLSAEELHRIYQELIRPVLFGEISNRGNETPPTLVLLGGQPGAGKSRAAARLTASHPASITSVTGDDLRIFHPNYRRLIVSAPEVAGSHLADATRVWVRAAIQEALDNRRSLLLEGTFGDPDTTLATADRFRRAGYEVRVVAIASPRVLSVITVTSRYLRDLKAGAPARLTRLSAHDRGFEGTSRLIDALDTGAPVDRTTILSRTGLVRFDDKEGQPEADAAATARDALHAGRHPEAWGARSTMELLGELKQITSYALRSGRLTPDVSALLLEAHTLTRQAVLPRLSIAAGSPQATAIRRAVEQQEATLRGATTAAPAPYADDRELRPTQDTEGPEL